MNSFIDFSHFTAAKNSFEGNPGLCNLFKFLSIETWKRLEFTYIKPKIKVLETTITQNIAFTINAYKREYPSLLIDVWEAADESANGNDLELIIIFSKFGFNFYAPVQAKKIYRNGHYTAMEHGDQIEKLITYANLKNGFPLYLLYNYVEPIPGNLSPDNELFGCSIVDAVYLKNHYYNTRTKKKRDGTRPLAWTIPSFNNLHPTHGFPWHELVCDLTPEVLLEKLYRIGGDVKRKKLIENNVPLKIENIKKNWNSYQGFISKKTLSYEGWFNTSDKNIMAERNASKDYKIQNKYQEYDLSSMNESSKNYIFNPQTRIVITI